MDSEVGAEISVPEEKMDRTQTVNEMVKLFGSEKRKRAFSAAQRNQVESEVLETALEPAFSHAEAKTEATPLAGQTVDVIVSNCISLIVWVVVSFQVHRHRVQV